MNSYTAIRDFVDDYYEGLNKIFPIEKHEIGKLYDEDPYFGYPREIGGSVWTSEGKALYMMIRKLKPKNILEIGNFKGVSSNHILKAIEDNNFGVVDLLDISECLDYPKLHNYNFERILANSIEHLDQPLEYDFYVIDGDHSYEHTKKELELIIANTQVPCYIWAHDYFVTHDPSCQVRKTWDEMAHHFSKIAYLKDSISNCGFVIAYYDTRRNIHQAPN